VKHRAFTVQFQRTYIIKHRPRCSFYCSHSLYICESLVDDDGMLLGMSVDVDKSIHDI